MVFICGVYTLCHVLRIVIVFGFLKSIYGIRGLIIPLGPSRDHFIGAFSLIMCVREVLLCDWPIELWTYESEVSKFPPASREAFLGIQNVTIHVLKDPVFMTQPTWDIEKDWLSDYIGFSSMSRALWSTKLGMVSYIQSQKRWMIIYALI